MAHCAMASFLIPGFLSLFVSVTKPTASLKVKQLFVFSDAAQQCIAAFTVTGRDKHHETGV